MWPSDPQDVLFKTQHGSKLYGLDHAGSDDDYYMVTRSSRAGQSIIGGVDTTHQPYTRFLNQCNNGVPQALEACFSQRPMVNHIAFITDNYVPSLTTMRERYYSTIKSFWLEGSYKRQRHACRLLLNLREAMARGRFNPTLTEDQKQEIQWMLSNLTEPPTL